MGKYNKFERKTPQARYKIHPVWAGIGFLMVIIVPIMSWGAATETVDLALKQGWPLIYDFPGSLALPEILYTLPIIGPISSFISSIANLPAIATFFLIILVLLVGVLSFIYAIIYRVVGPPRYMPNDAPAQRIRTKKYKR